ncbi:MAG: hypothetical protein L0221_06130 [Chloroflexi bacterium]|nr:hypothetical protein [Chloroflexota bacterium]
MRRGPTTEEAAPDFEHAQPTLAGLVTGGEVWRNDGEGWYRTDIAPSIGLDPATLAVLPRLLRDAASPSDAGVVVDGLAVRSVVTATGRISDAPGLIAVDLGPKSELRGAIEFQLDGLGRLVLLRANVRNLNEQTFDLVTEVTIEFDWSGPGNLPKPEPVIDPDKNGSAG